MSDETPDAPKPIDEFETGAAIVDEILVKMGTLKDYQFGDAMTLVDLFLSKDARTIEEMVADEEQHEYVVERVGKLEKDNMQEISFDGGLTGGFQIPEGRPIAEVGDRITLYSVGPVFGGRRRGFSLNGELYEYLTPWEQFAQRMAMLAEHDRRHRERAVAERAQVDQWLEDLEGPFKARIIRFREKDPLFDMVGGTYETYPCLMAQRIAKYVALTNGWWLDPETYVADGVDPEEIRSKINDFHESDQIKQREVIHAGKDDAYGISGHQFDFACGMALNAMVQGVV